MTRVEFEIDPKHALTVSWATWIALGEALGELGRHYPDDRWKEPLRERILAAFERGNIEQTENGAGPLSPGIIPHLKNFEDAALSDAITAINAAFDRIAYR
ncbi:hypothetical protein [Pseudogemmobacter faecipullorum]|uniref:Uncharacterized protein n=1 Tax=Pseudogemmobacter faecipullorum TaxID=2755041 RepID=A0ABS8CSQ8_9RHOB|nr:hypothetical protein [Pseudogemmobacter faecipullorum]MCB5412422.1 hypothetical protein [Pseudogemmobacter faecipullorum]